MKREPTSYHRTESRSEAILADFGRRQRCRRTPRTRAPCAEPLLRLNAAAIFERPVLGQRNGAAPSSADAIFKIK
ncbi:hypothetical protein EVAR_53847_1 [Eumeta japonica]|uniref:Uncharacterized protein n=1 Tax=Eumeta variegata TaxID=151549 RepID=A0A4C1XIF2_EUMVA|nr:hypothetical protein EVAR_53847_1 [Eumeta japonica]